MKTLVDCSCVARVHEDGSGVEIDYCPSHSAAADLFDGCVNARDVLLSLSEDEAAEESRFMPALNLLRTAIAKAEGL